MERSILFASLSLILMVSYSPVKPDRSSGKEAVVMSLKSENKSKSIKSKNMMYPKLSTYIESVVAGLESIPQERKELLEKISTFIEGKRKSNEPTNLTFICTHNSRRSHLSQIWAATAAAYYGIEDGMNTYSGGTESTAFNPRAVAAIERAGFGVENPGGENPHYKVTYGEKGRVLECFSKKYDDPYNAKENFVAVMTCSHADQNCPIVFGASLRVAIPYVDPKESDGTDLESATYDERCKQIATEMFYMMSKVGV